MTFPTATYVNEVVLMVAWLVPIITLLFGLIIGYLAQRSGFCSIGGFRDLLLFKQTRLFFGYMALIASAALGYFIFSLIVPYMYPGYPWAATQTTNVFTPIPGAPGGLSVGAYLILSIIGGLGLGLLGVFLGGCPLRQMVMGSEGNVASFYFVAGLAVGAILFHSWFVQAFFQIVFGAIP